MKTRLFLSSAVLTVLATAQTIAPKLPDSGQLLRQNAPQLQPAVPATPRQGEQALAAPVEVPGDQGPRFKVDNFLFEGNKSVASATLAELCAPYLEKDISLSDLNRIARLVTDYYRRKGYFLAQAYVPPQQTRSGGTVTLTIMEGVLESVSVATQASATRVPRRLLEAYAAKIPTGVPAEEGALNNVTTLLNELPAVTSRVVLEPGSERGTAKAKVEINEGEPYQIWIDGDNYGSYATGFYRVGARLALYSPLRLGDRLDVHVQSSTTGNTQIANTGYSVPVGTNGARVGADYSYVRYKLGESFDFLKAKGHAHDLALNLNYPVVHTQLFSFDLRAALEGKKLDDRMDTFDTSNRRELLNGQLGASAMVMDKFLGGASSSVTVTGYFGSVKLQDATTLANDKPPLGYGLDGDYKKISLMVSRNQLLFRGLTLFTMAMGQWADGNLDSSEQFSLGGPYAVRAYPLQEAMCDQGFLTTAELRYPIGNLAFVPSGTQLGIFVDHAEGKLRKSPGVVAGGSSEGNTRVLTGLGFGLTWYKGDVYSARLSVAWRATGKPTTDNNVGDNPTIYFQVTKRL